MSQSPLPESTLRETREAVEAALRAGYPPPGHSSKTRRGALSVAAEALGLPVGTVQYRVKYMERRGGGPDWSLWRQPARPAPAIAPAPERAADSGPDGAALIGLLRRGPLTLAELAQRLSTTKGQVLDAIERLQAEHVAVEQVGERYGINAAPPPAFVGGDLPTYLSRPDGSYVFGALGDSHLASKYARLDALADLYDWYAEQGVDRVFHTGNWVDGEAKFNTHDLLVHGMEGQLRYLAEHYPRRPGIRTYAVAGDDHEGWWAQREGVDVGRYAERILLDSGRDDWINLGYMEAHIRLVHAQSGQEAILAVVHPGGGSAYADSYSIQKIIESLEGGEKPAVALYGHYHKLMFGEYRGVFWCQTGCTQDQTPFARKKKLRFAIGGALMRLQQDPRTGAIVGAGCDFRRYFNRGYYNDRWSHAGDVTLAQRLPDHEEAPA